MQCRSYWGLRRSASEFFPSASRGKFGTLQGSGTVWLGSQSATAVSWSDTLYLKKSAYQKETEVPTVAPQ
jgi:hypothetical protein